ncbi:DNA replication/repair protein RecF [Patescibacteria group bacterium]
MQLRTLKLNNFRNFSKLELNFSDRNLICGKNGSGKTNILEAIHLVCTGKSFRSNNNQNYIKNTKPDSSIFIDYEDELKKTKNKQSVALEANDLNKIQKTLYRNSKKVGVSDFIGRAPVIIFAPEELKMIWGSPKDRRSILDLFIAQTKPSYAIQLLKYSRVVRQRNKLLFVVGIGHAKAQELEFWNSELISVGSDIIHKRNNTIKGLNKYIQGQYTDISGTKDRVSLTVESTVDSEALRLKPEEILNLYKKKLYQNIKSDIKQGNTSIGPHRDDIQININNSAISNFGSRGEGKTAVLAMKFSQKKYLKEIYGIQKCLFLLDDAFSELDKTRAQYLLESLSDEQSIFTYTSIHPKTKKFNLIQL